MPIRILIVDDHAIVRDGLKMILESLSDMDVVGEAKNGRDALERAEVLRPDVILMDISMPELSGIEATHMICKRLPSVRIIMLSMHHTNEHILRAMQAGAWAYILKESAGSCVVDAIRTVMRGKKYFGEGIEEPPKMHFVLQNPLDILSRRERETLQLVVEGKTNAFIAEQFNISQKSVETYRSRMMLKLDISNVPALVVFALQHGIISLSD